MLVDKSGELSRRVSWLVRRPPEIDTPERALFLCCSLINWTLMGTNLLKRGEYARAEAFLMLVHGHLLQAVRMVEGKSAKVAFLRLPTQWFASILGLFRQSLETVRKGVGTTLRA